MRAWSCVTLASSFPMEGSCIRMSAIGWSFGTSPPNLLALGGAASMSCSRLIDNKIAEKLRPCSNHQVSESRASLHSY